MAFNISPVAPTPPVTSDGFPSYLQFQNSGSNLGEPDVDTVNFRTGLTATRGTGENANRVTIDVAESISTLRADLASTSGADEGAGMVGFDWGLNYAVDTVGWGLMTARYSILKYIPVAQWAAIFAGTSTYDATANIASALAAESVITLPPGRIRGEWDFTAKRGITVQGAGRDKTTLQNVDATPVITLNNTGSDCKLNSFRDFRIMNRDEATYTTCDGILIDGNSVNENDFHTFERLEILDMRYGVNIANRTIWNTWNDVHITSCIADGFRCVTTQNVSVQKFDQCRFGANGGYGMYLEKASGDPFFGWVLDAVTLEKNSLNGLRVSGAASGISGFTLTGGHFEENTTTVLAGSTAPRKANIFIDAAQCVGLNIIGVPLLGTPLATPLDWAVYISSTTCSGIILPSRPGTFAQGFAHVSAGVVIVAPQDGGTTSLSGAGAMNMSWDVASSFTGTLTGCTTLPTGTVAATKTRYKVRLTLPVIEGTSNTTDLSITGVPASLRPSAVRTIGVRVRNNGAYVYGMAQVDPSGVINFYTDFGGGGFTAVGTKGVAAWDDFEYAL